MKHTILILLLTGLMTGGYSVESYASASLDSKTKSELADRGKKKKKRYKGYKKPRNKKFLGLFKRKSSCDCPKF